MAEGVSVRAFRRSDREQLAALWRTVFPDDPPRNAPEAVIDRKLGVQPELLLVAEGPSGVVGAVMAGYDGFRGWIYHLAVSPDHRRQGIGTMLVRAAEEKLRGLGCPKVNLQIRSSNAAVAEFYRGIGYVVEDRVSMGRALEPGTFSLGGANAGPQRLDVGSEDRSAPTPRIDGYDVRRLGSGEEAELQDLHERCSDYYQLIEGGPTRATSAREDLTELPPGKQFADKFYFGIYDSDRKLVGALELARDLPAAGEWWLALLLLDPEVRGGGLGARVLDSTKRWVRMQGGSSMSLAVLEQNTRAERFWRRHGFVDQKRSRFTAASGLVSGMIIMRCALA